MFRNLQALRWVSQRTFSGSSQRSIQNRVPERQKLFQEDNGLPVHLRGGTSDVISYKITALLTAIVGSLAVYELSVSKK